jgi:AcrR family transcriptional regulator
MPRRPAPQRRDQLEEALISYVLIHGIADLSLRPVAEALGVSPYALIYHFGSKEGVVAAAVAGIEERQRVQATALLAGAQAISPADLVRRYWHDWCLNPSLLPYHRLFYEVYALALQHPDRYPGVLERGGWVPWTDLVRSFITRNGVTGPEADGLAALMVSTVAGALLGVLTTGESEAATRAVEMLASYVEQRIAAVQSS